MTRHVQTGGRLCQQKVKVQKQKKTVLEYFHFYSRMLSKNQKLKQLRFIFKSIEKAIERNETEK